MHDWDLHAFLMRALPIGERLHASCGRDPRGPVRRVQDAVRGLRRGRQLQGPVRPEPPALCVRYCAAGRAAGEQLYGLFPYNR